MEDLLRGMGQSHSDSHLASAILGIMACLPTFETSSFPHAFGIFLQGEFLELYQVHIHGIGVARSLRGGGGLGSESRIAHFLPQFIDA